MLDTIENNLSNISKNKSNVESDNKKHSKASKSILIDKDKDNGLDNEAITNQIKKQMSKSERLLRNEYNHQFEDVESKINATTKAVESRMQDFEELIGEKMKMIDRKILETLSERSYQFHEKNTEFLPDKTEQSFQSRTIENKLKSIENRISKFENANIKHEDDEQIMEKISYIEDKLIETTEIAMQAEKASSDAESQTRKL